MDEIIYLNHAGTSWPKPKAVIEAVHRAMESTPLQWESLFEEAHESICRFFGVSRPENLLFTPGCTASLQVAIANAEIPAGSRVLTSCWEHHAVEAPLRGLEKRGLTVSKIRPCSNGLSVDLDCLEAELATGGVALVAITAACNVTGDLLPVKEIIDLSHRFGSMVLIDAAQIAGWVDINLDHLGADFVAFGGHKALQAPWGVGVLYLSPTARLSGDTALCSVLLKTMNSTLDFQQNRPRRPGYCEVGTVNRTALAGLHAALGWRVENPFTSTLSMARSQVARIEVALREVSSVRILGSSNLNDRLPTIAFEDSRHASTFLAERFRRRGLISGQGLLCSSSSNQMWGTETTGVVRLSVGVSQSDEAIDKAISQLKILLTEGE